MIWRRAVLLFLLTVTGLALETTLFGAATLAGSKPPLLLLVTVAFAMREGPAAGATAGFVTGFATDLLGGGTRGITALVYTLVGYWVGKLRAQVQAPSVRLPVLMASAATLVAVVGQGAVGAILGAPVSGWGTARSAALAAGYNALLTPFVFPVVRSLSRRLHPDRGRPLMEGLR
ncbi:MAG: rod shape-determining protein MreD [Acidobacteria bacterium]|nr:rod shape-determining protein MreD [Acidobacteriota bacterium]